MQTSRRSTSSGLIFLNSCLIHSHSRAQNSVALSSMEAEILAATGLLVEGIYIKQVLQFLVDDKGGLSNQNNKVMMRLRLDSTSAQAFFSRLGPGKAKHLATRLLWTQQTLRRNWFCVERIATRENPADLNTKALSKERRTFLMRRIGLERDVFEDEGEFLPGQSRKKQLVKLLVNMVLASNLQGCSTTLKSATSSLADAWSTTSWAWTFAMMVIILLVILVLRLIYKMTLLMEEVKKYKAVWETIRGVAKLSNNEDPFCAEVTGEQAYDYLCELRRLHAGPAKSRGFLESVGFAKGLLGAEVDCVLKSSRVKGVAWGSDLVPVKKEAPFTCQQLIALQRLAFFGEGPKSIFAGYICFLVRCRLRWSDGQHCIREPVLDLTDGRGFLEAALYHHKTAKKRRTHVVRLLLVAAVIPGLSGIRVA